MIEGRSRVVVVVTEAIRAKAGEPSLPKKP